MAKKSTTLVDMREDLRQTLIAELEMATSQANSVAVCVINRIRKIYGGEALYVPKEDDLDERDWAMWEMFNGTNYDEVGRAFDLTGRQVRNRIRIIRPIAQAREQKGLFDDYLCATKE